MAEHGGYRRPANPAPVSGPGALSRRTDGNQPIVEAPGGAYGDRQELTQLQQGAPIGRDPNASPPPAAGIDLSGITPLSAPSSQPNVPVTSGADAGAGSGSDALGILDPQQADARDLAKYLPAFLEMSQRDDLPGFRSWVRRIIAQM